MTNTEFINEVVELTNQFRAQHGLGALTIDWDLAEAAQKHSENMAYQDFFSHIAPDGSKPWDRTREAGYESISVGENIAAGFTTPEAVVNGWINSDGHRANMLNGNFNEIGVGYFYLPNDPGNLRYGAYWTQVFGKGVIESVAETAVTPAISPATPAVSPVPQVASDESFVALQYGASYGDLIEAYGDNVGALWRHYLDYGQGEGRSLDQFNEVGYLAAYDDLLNACGKSSYAAVEHYVQYGYYEGRSQELFAASQYLASYGDLAAAYGLDYQAAAKHFVDWGYSEGRVRDRFDEGRYLASNHDLIEALGYDLEAATRHYISYGMSEQRSLDSFDPAAYLARYGDLQAAYGDDLNAAARHFVEYGYSEGRIGTA